MMRSAKVVLAAAVALGLFVLSIRQARADLDADVKR